MRRTRTKMPIGQRSLVPALALLALLVIGGYALVGPTGVLAWSDYQQQLVQKQHDLAVLREQKSALQNRVHLLDPNNADPDLVAELLKRELNVARPDEIIVPLNAGEGAAESR